MQSRSRLSTSQEEYMSAIWALIQEKGSARVTDISRKLGVKNPSVTTALKNLAEKALIHYAPYDSASLTEQGRLLAESIERRQRILRTFLEKVLSLDTDTAKENARHIEHALAPEVIHRLTKFIEYYETCPGEKVRWIDGRGYFCEGRREGCESCIQLR